MASVAKNMTNIFLFFFCIEYVWLLTIALPNRSEEYDFNIDANEGIPMRDE